MHLTDRQLTIALMIVLAVLVVALVFVAASEAAEGPLAERDGGRVGAALVSGVLFRWISAAALVAAARLVVPSAPSMHPPSRTRAKNSANRFFCTPRAAL
jgi:heme A synthase